MIDIRDLDVVFGHGKQAFHAVRQVSLAVEAGQSFGLVGESGSGKTTVLRALAEALGKPASELRIYDPYFCAGAAQRHLAKLGFPRCHNVNEDFYLNLVSGNLPAHDVLLTNPPCECALPASRRRLC